MAGYTKFCLECVKWAYGRWGKGERVVTLVLVVVSLLGATGFVAGIIKWGSLVYLLIIPLFFVFVVAPYKLWKQKSDELTRLTNKRLKASVSPPDITFKEGIQDLVWYHLRVDNPTAQNIKDCFGKLLHSSTQENVGYTLPHSGIRYPWSTYGGPSCLTRNIPSQGHDLLDIAVYDGNYLYTPVLARDGFTRNLLFPLPEGSYEVTIQVGSETEDFQPNIVKVKIDFPKGRTPTVEVVEGE